MDISGPRERNYDRLFTSRLRFEPYFSPSISRRRSSRARYEVTGGGVRGSNRYRPPRWTLIRRCRRRRMKRHGFSTSFRCQRSLLVNHSPLSSLYLPALLFSGTESKDTVRPEQRGNVGRCSSSFRIKV